MKQATMVEATLVVAALAATVAVGLIWMPQWLRSVVVWVWGSVAETIPWMALMTATVVLVNLPLLLLLLLRAQLRHPPLPPRPPQCPLQHRLRRLHPDRQREDANPRT